METLTLLRRLAEQHNYPALHETCLEAGSAEPAVQILLALAEVHLGDAPAGQHRLACLDQESLGFDTRVDLAAVHIALAEFDQAVTILETARREVSHCDKTANALLLARLAWCRLQQGDRDEARVLYEQSLTLHPFLAVYLNLLRQYRDNGRLTEMAVCLDAAWRFWTEDQIGWPDNQRQIYNRQLQGLQLDLWLAQERFEAVDAWIERQHRALGEDDWGALVSGLAQRLAARDRHVQAEEWLRSGLLRYPGHTPLLSQLAELAQAQGRTFQAMALLRRAIRVATARDEEAVLLWTRLSAISLATHPGLARQAVERARNQLASLTEKNSRGIHEVRRHSDTVDERFLQVELALAGVEAQELNFSAAEQRYRRVLEQRPQMIAALQGLGQICMQLGRIDEAVALFKGIRAIDPARGHTALIHARRFPKDEATLHQIEQLTRTPNLESSVHTGLLFQLASAWETRANWDKAFALVDEANFASRRLLRYDPKAHRQHCARIRHAFPRALYDHRRDSGLESTLPVFVVGMPRSGTTLVEQIIAGHSRIHGAGELGVIPRVIAGLERWERHTGSGRHYPDCVDDLDAKVSRGIAERVLSELREYAPEADHVVDKLPHNFENIGLIRLLFPHARIISVRRDPRDIAISNYFTDYAGKHGGMGFGYDLDWIGEQLADHNLLIHHWQQVFPGEILEIRYEDLVDDPETCARQMLDYIGVDWESQVLEFDTLERPVKTASVWQVRQPLYSSSKARWQRYRKHLQPLFNATNRKITWDPIEMVTLPKPGWLNAGVDHYQQGDLDTAEQCFRRLLHHLPDHAAARFMLGLIHVRKGQLGDGIPLMEQACECCPWNRRWRGDLAQAYRLDGREAEAAALADNAAFDHAGDDPAASLAESSAGEEPVIDLDYLFLSGETTCSNSESAPSRARS